MNTNKIFVGRKEELEQFKEVLENLQGQAVLVVGQAGMGKTWLINKMAEIAENHPELKCGSVRYEVTPTDSVDSTMALMMDNAFEAAQVTEKSFNGTTRRLEQWRSLLNVINIGDLAMSLRRDPQQNTRDQFLKRLELISGRIKKNQRVIFIIDPEKYMQKESDQSWAIVVKDLPEKIKFVFAQRPEDVLVESETFDRLDNVVTIPEKRLDVLKEADVDELVKCRRAKLPVSIPELRKILKRYNGHPYAIGAALDLIEAGTKLEELPERPEPTKFAEVQWKELSKRGKDAIRLLKGYAILEVGVPDDVVESVSEVDSDTRQHLLADKFLGGLLRDEGEGRRIYHAILADYILGQIGEAEKKEYHSRAAGIYRERLHKDIKPNLLAAVRLPEHILETQGQEDFVGVFINECFEPLRILGVLDTCISLSERTLKMVKKGSERQAILLGNLGLIYQKKGDLDKAEQMHKKALGIDEKLRRLEGMANQYGNLGLIYQTRGDLDRAEKMYHRVLEIEEKLGRPHSIANAYGNLGVIYWKRRDLDKAEEMHKKSLEIEKKLGRLEGIAGTYAALGLVYDARGDFGKAEEWHRKSLDIEEKLGHLEGMARQYSNLGLIYKRRGDIGKAKEYLEKALGLYKKIGMQHMVKEVQGWIDREVKS